MSVDQLPFTAVAPENLGDPQLHLGRMLSDLAIENLESGPKGDLLRGLQHLQFRLAAGREFICIAVIARGDVCDAGNRTAGRRDGCFAFTSDDRIHQARVAA